MQRRGFIALLGGTMVLWPLAARVQQPTRKAARIGWLGLGSFSPGEASINAFENELRHLGYLVGKSLFIEYRFAEGRFERLEAIAAELVQLPVDVIFTPTTAATVAARNTTTRVPIVFANVRDPVASGLVVSLARPGGNITGLSWEASSEVIAKQLQLLREVHTRVSKVAVLWNPAGHAGNRRALQEATEAARLMRLQLRIVEARAPNQLESAFRTISEGQADGLLVLSDVMFYEHRATLGKLALGSGLPTIVGSKEDLAAGCLMAYGASRIDLIRRAAGYVDKILKGAMPADLPVQQPTKFDLIINLVTGKALGLKLPESLLVRADELIE